VAENAPRCGEQPTRLELNPLPALQGCTAPMGGAPGLLGCGTAQRGMRIALHVNDLAESDTIEIGSAIGVSAH
jgi:hypothetical protein